MFGIIKIFLLVFSFDIYNGSVSESSTDESEDKSLNILFFPTDGLHFVIQS